MKIFLLYIGIGMCNLWGMHIMAQPVVDLGGDPFACGSLVLDAGNPGANFVWSTGETTQVIEVEESGEYWVAVTAAGVEVRDTVEVTVVPPPGSLLPMDTVVCGNGWHRLNIRHEAERILWYDAPSGGELLGTEDSLRLWVEDAETVYAASVNFAPSFILGENFPELYVSGGAGLRFDVKAPVTIKSVGVFVDGDASFDLVLRKGADQLFSRRFHTQITGVGTRIDLPLFLDLPRGNNYRLVLANLEGPGELGLRRSNLNYPYEVEDLISIKGNQSGQEINYPYFFHWDVSALRCESERVPVRVQANLPLNLSDSVYTCDPLTLQAGIEAQTYRWNNLGQDPSLLVDTTGWYVLEASDGQDCTVRDSSFVEFPIEVGLPEDGILCGEILQTLYGSSASFLWSTGATSPTLVLSEPGTYGVEVTESRGCTLTDTITVTGFVEAPVIDLGSFSVLCAGTKIGPADPFAMYVWSTGAETPTIEVSASGLYWLKGIDENGCVARDSVNIRVEPKPQADFSIEQNGCTFWFRAASPLPVFNWNFGDGQSSTEISPFHTYRVSGEYKVRLITGNACGADTVIQWVNCTVLSDDEVLEEAFFLYPNPAHQWVELELKSSFGQEHPVIRLFSLEGREVKTKVETLSPNRYRLYVGTLPEGVYAFQAIIDTYRLQQHIWVLHP